MWWALLLLLGPTDVFAGSAKAELQQLDEEVRLLVAKNAWTGVERIYLQMAPLESRGVHLEWDHHLWGALAAQARGDVLSTWQRLRAAEAVESREESLVWLATLEATHGRASIELSPLVFGAVTLETLDPVVDPTAQKTIDLASRLLTETRTFDGLLPLGRYRLGVVRFDIDGGPLIRVRVEPGQAKARALPTPPGTLRFVAQVLPTAPGAVDAGLAGAREAAAGTPGVASAVVVPVPDRRLYVDFAPGALESLGLTATEAAAQLRVALAPLEVLPGPDSVSVPPAAGAERVGAVPLAFEGGSVTVKAVARVSEAPDRTAPPPGLLLELTPTADAETVRQAVLQRVEGSELRLASP
jgi:hypothetical protein